MGHFPEKALWKNVPDVYSIVENKSNETEFAKIASKIRAVRELQGSKWFSRWGTFPERFFEKSDPYCVSYG